MSDFFLFMCSVSIGIALAQILPPDWLIAFQGGLLLVGSSILLCRLLKPGELRGGVFSQLEELRRKHNE